jgi:hypothetical protein
MDKDIKGFVELSEGAVPFQYENGILNIFPINQQKWKEGFFDRLQNMLQEFNNGIKNEWVPRYTINGTTSNQRSIVFFCVNKLSNNDGFERYEVSYYLIYDEKKISPKKIDGIILTGEELDYFYLPSKAFESSKTLEGGYISSFVVRANMTNSVLIPEYTLKQGVKIQPTLSVDLSIHARSEVPIKAQTEVVLGFSKSMSLENTIDVMFQFKTFLRYVCYRRNVRLKKVKIFALVNAKPQLCGDIVFNENSLEELNSKKKNRILSYDLLLDKTSNILQAIADGTMYFEHLCDNIDATSSYGIDRIILLFVAFEREYRNVYGTDADRSEVYLNAKVELCDVITNIINKSSREKRKYFKGFRNFIQKTDNSFEDRLKSAINNCKDILKPFLSHHYHTATDDYMSDIADRMKQMRNDAVHGNIDLQVDPINMSDFKIIEILLYVMRLNYIGVKPKNIQQMICNLFGYNIYIK